VRAVAVVLANLAVLAGAVFGVVRSGARPQVLLYAFIVDYCLRLVTIEALTGQSPGGRGWSARLAPLISSPPAAGQTPVPFVEEQSKRPLGFRGYVVVTAFLAVAAFVLSHVDARHELDVDMRLFWIDVQWAAVLGLMYWVQSLASRTIVIDAGASREMNFGYSTRELTVFAVAVLTAGGAVMVRQIAGKPATGWVVLGPLLAFRFLFDLAAGLRASRTSTSLARGT